MHAESLVVKKDRTQKTSSAYEGGIRLAGERPPSLPHLSSPPRHFELEWDARNGTTAAGIRWLLEAAGW